MKVNWLWDTQVKENQVRGILRDEKNPRFYMYAEKLFSRVTDPSLAFDYINKKTFCRKWPNIKKRVQKDAWAQDKVETWQKIYETVFHELKSRGFHVRKPSHLKVSSEISGIAQQIKEIRIQRGYTQEDMAKKLGVIQQYISKIETGRENISIESLKKFAEALNKKLVIQLQ